MSNGLKSALGVDDAVDKRAREMLDTNMRTLKGLGYNKIDAALPALRAAAKFKSQVASDKLGTLSDKDLTVVEDAMSAVVRVNQAIRDVGETFPWSGFPYMKEASAKLKDEAEKMAKEHAAKIKSAKDAVSATGLDKKSGSNIFQTIETIRHLNKQKK